MRLVLINDFQTKNRLLHNHQEIIDRSRSLFLLTRKKKRVKRAQSPQQQQQQQQPLFTPFSTMSVTF